MNDQCAAQTEPSTRAWRFRRFVRARLHDAYWQIKLLFLRIAYRRIMRVSHYFGWCYAPIRGPLMPGNEMYRWCQWCGLRGTVIDTSKGPLRLDAAPEQGEKK